MNDMNIVPSCIQSMRGFDLMNITHFFLVCMGCNIRYLLTLKICYYRGKCSYDCSVLFIGSCSSYVVSDLKNVLSYSSLIFVTNFKFIYKNYFFNILFLSFIILIFYHYNLNTISIVTFLLLLYYNFFFNGRS